MTDRNETYEIESDIDSLVDTFQQQLDELIMNLPEARAEQLGLDSRCGSAHVAENSIFVRKGNTNRMFQYYGGFEYVDAEFVTHCGDWVRYSREYDEEQFEDDDGNYVTEPNGRIDRCIENFFENNA